LNERHIILPVFEYDGDAKPEGVAVFDVFASGGTRQALSDAVNNSAVVFTLPDHASYMDLGPHAADKAQSVHVSLECKPPTPVHLNDSSDEIFVRDPAAGATVLVIRLERRGSPGPAISATVVLRTSTLLDLAASHPRPHTSLSAPRAHVVDWPTWAPQTRLLRFGDARANTVLSTKILCYKSHSWSTLEKLPLSFLDFDTAPSISKDLSAWDADTASTIVASEPNESYPPSAWKEPVPSTLLYRQDAVTSIVLSRFNYAFFGEDFVLVFYGPDRCDSFLVNRLTCANIFHSIGKSCTAYRLVASDSKHWSAEASS
jgi:hypothetical protein